jgi:hypothetical protein
MSVEILFGTCKFQLRENLLGKGVFVGEDVVGSKREIILGSISF